MSRTSIMHRAIAGSFALGLVLTVGIVVPPPPAQAGGGGHSVVGTALLTEDELVSWWNSRVPSTICNVSETVDGTWTCKERVTYEFRAGDGSVTPRGLIRRYLEEGAREGVAADIAFIQGILETAWFFYPDSGQVRPYQNNFAGMGAYDNSGGDWVFEFPNVRTGVRAQLQHLRIYGDPTVNEKGTNLGSSLAKDVEDRYPDRWRLIRNATWCGGYCYWAQAQTWEEFGDGMWATDPAYASKILNLYAEALVHNGYPTDAAMSAAWHYRFTNTGGSANAVGYFGRDGDVPLACDWNGNGQDTPGVFRDGTWIITNNRNGSGPYTTFQYGRKGDLPICGDWSGNGRDTVGIVRDREWHLRNDLRGGASHVSFIYGRVTEGDVPIVGDWNGNGQTTVGIIRDGEWHLRNSLSGGRGQIVFTYGRITQGDRPLIGDWNGNGQDTIGIVRGREWHLRNSLSGGRADNTFIYGRVTAGDVPLMGDWNADGRSTPAIVR